MSSRQVAQTGVSGVAESACRHHWLIETPNGNPMNLGTCKHCGLVKEFRAAGEKDPQFNSTLER